MRLKRFLPVLCVIIFSIATCGNVSGMDVGDGEVALSANDIDATVTHIGDFDWSLSTDGSSVSISVDASINDGGVVVDFTALIFLNAQLLDGTTHLPKGSDHDEHTNPNFPNTDDSSQWPLGQYSNTTLTISFPAASLSVGDYIHLHLSASGENDSASETDDDECLFTVTVMP